MLSAAIFYALAGLVAGSVFTIGTLLLLLSILILEAASLALADARDVGIWIILNVAAVQTGYLAGFFARKSLEQAGYAIRPVELSSPQ